MHLSHISTDASQQDSKQDTPLRCTPLLTNTIRPDIPHIFTELANRQNTTLLMTPQIQVEVQQVSSK
jgi:hypothetical protein